MEALRRWWPVLVIVGIAVAAMAVMRAMYDGALGHASEHLGSAVLAPVMLAVFAIVVWAIPGAWRRPEVWIGGALLLYGVVGVIGGNIEVVDALDGTNYDYEQAAAFGPSRPGFESGHDASESAMWIAVLGAVVVAAGSLARRDVSFLVGGIALVLTVFFPPWVLPGFGLIILAVAACRRYRRASARAPDPVPAFAAT